MSSSFYATIGDWIIPNGTNISQVYNGVYVYHDAVGIQIYSPAILPESVYIEVNQDQMATNSSSGWEPYEVFDLSGNSINLYVPTAGKSQTYQEFIFAGSARLKSSTNVAADRAFKVNKLWI